MGGGISAPRARLAELVAALSLGVDLGFGQPMEAGRRLGLPPEQVLALRRAGYVHGFGRLGVSNSIWDRPGPLSAGEWERIRMYPYLTERMLHQSAALAPLGEIAVQHRERLDGSGYPRGLSGGTISRLARVLGAADAYASMRELRWADWFRSGGSGRRRAMSRWCSWGRRCCSCCACCRLMPDACWCWKTCTGLTRRLWRCWSIWPTISRRSGCCAWALCDEDGGEVAGLASALEARGSAAVLPLGRLDPTAAAQMALACVGAADLPSAVQSLVAERAEGLPFLVEEILAGLIGEGSLTEQDGRWHAGDLARAGVPGTFADAVRRRLDGLDGDARSVICAAAVLGRRFDWALLGPVTGLPDAAVAAALRRGVGLQLVAADGNSFRFRHALTHEAVLAGLLPPERAMLAGQALAAVEAAHSGLPGTWCTLAAELAEGAGDAGRAGTLLLEAGRRDLAVGALASAEHTLMQARMLTGADDVVLRTPVDEALTEVYALSGQVDRAIEMGKTLLARLGGQAESARAGMLHLGIARAAIAGARWAEAEASIGVARRSADVSAAQVDACAAQVAAGRGLLREAEELAQAALAVAENGGLPEVACEALEVIGRVARQHDLSAAEQAFERAVAVATAHGLQLWRLRALHELGTIDQLRTESVDRLQQARELAVAQGALALTATLDLQIAAGLNKQFRSGEALEAARRSAEASRRFRLATLPMALIFQATAHAVRGEQQDMEAMIAEAVALAPDDPDVLGCSWGHCRATFCLLAEDLDQAHAQMTTGAGLLLGSPATIAPPFLGLWPLLGALLDRDAEDAAARVRAAHGTRHLVVGSLLGYAGAILAGRQSRRAEAEAAFAAADGQMGPLVAWYRHFARRICAQAALADGWGDPVCWLREAVTYFAARGDDRVAAACRGLLRRAGVPVPRSRAGSGPLPGRLRALGVTEREADVLRLAARGMGNREIAEAMFLSPRTVEKHVASVLAKTGLRRSQLAGYAALLD